MLLGTVFLKMHLSTPVSESPVYHFPIELEFLKQLAQEAEFLTNSQDDS